MKWTSSAQPEMTSSSSKSKRLGLVVAALASLGLASPAAAADMVLSVGESFSSGLGESSISPALKAAYVKPALAVAGSFDFSRKVETGAGWIAGIDADRAFGSFTVGADYRMRNGGPWTKNVLFARVGMGVASFHLLYRHELASDAGAAHNDSRVLQISRRFACAGPHRLVLEPTLSVLRFRRMDGSHGTGILLQLWLGMARSLDSAESN